MDNSAKTDLADKLKSANNILVTVSRNPSVDQLAACIGLTLLLNKLGKHAAAIFSGEVPSTLEFLQPEETLEKNTDSLRDFIIALDKSKADKLRYKVEDNVVRIFITPYRTSISQNDLEFSQGDFNVDVVVALGVRQQEDLDNAITVHGRILHDAVIASVNTSTDGGLGSIAWHDPQASSLSELVTDLAMLMGDDTLDSQIATALLTGVVAATDRFSNEKTSSQTMNVSAKLMAAGANQQLVASKLDTSGMGHAAAAPAAAPAPDEAARGGDGTLEIDHAHEAGPPLPPELEELTRDPDQAAQFPTQPPLPPEPMRPQIHDTHTEAGDLVPQHGRLPDMELPTPQFSPPPQGNSVGGIMTQPPAMGGTLTANSEPEGLDPAIDPLSLPSQHSGQLLDHNDPNSARSLYSQPSTPTFEPPMAPASAVMGPPASQPPDGQTLADLEKSVNSPHLDPGSGPEPAPEPALSPVPAPTAAPMTSVLGDARDAVSQALVSDNVAHPEPIQALGAQPLGAPLHPSEPPQMPEPPAMPGMPQSPEADEQPSGAPLQPPSGFGAAPAFGNPGSVISPSPVPTPDMPPAAAMPAPLTPDSGQPAIIMPSGAGAGATPPPVPPPIPFQFSAPPGPQPGDGPMMPL